MTKCQKCGAETGPAFALCVACIHEEDGTRNHYIEFRVYLHQDANGDEVRDVADVLQDVISDVVSGDNAPDCFTQDVTYEVVRTMKADHYSCLTKGKVN